MGRKLTDWSTIDSHLLDSTAIGKMINCGNIMPLMMSVASFFADFIITPQP